MIRTYRAELAKLLRPRVVLVAACWPWCSPSARRSSCCRR